MIRKGSIDPRLLEGVFYRVPTQGQGFFTPFRIVGFLPPSYGNVVIMPPSNVPRDGSDHDADVKRAFFRNAKMVAVEDKNGRVIYRMTVDEGSEKARFQNLFVDLLLTKLMSLDFLQTLLRYQGSTEALMVMLNRDWPAESIIENLTHPIGNAMAHQVAGNQAEAGKNIVGVVIAMFGMAPICQAFRVRFENPRYMDKTRNEPRPMFINNERTVVVHEDYYGVDQNYKGQTVENITNTFVTIVMDSAKSNHAGINNLNTNTIGVAVYLILTGYSFDDVIYLCRSVVGSMFAEYRAITGNVFLFGTPPKNFCEFVKNTIEARVKTPEVQQWIKTVDSEKTPAVCELPAFRLPGETERLFRDLPSFLNYVQTLDPEQQIYHLEALVKAGAWMDRVYEGFSALSTVNAKIFRAFSEALPRDEASLVGFVWELEKILTDLQNIRMGRRVKEEAGLGLQNFPNLSDAIAYTHFELVAGTLIRYVKETLTKKEILFLSSEYSNDPLE
ncbi:MAG: hypothetical protein RMM53_11280, partial [Bacteroidia bacterium]|nr:hypothetical protein [Bacteroidia bacterium]MDW8334788.1 hypothetical protein [Bacteroidia bacterium]